MTRNSKGSGSPAPVRKLNDDYWNRSRRPWPSLLLIAPFLVVYEVAAARGLFDDVGRNGADLWMRQTVYQIPGFSERIAPLLAPLLLLGWHLRSRHPWKVRTDDCLGMLSESALAACLFVGAGSALQTHLHPSMAIQTAGRVVAFFGAGIYEEFLFRMLLLPLLYLFFQSLLRRRGLAIGVAICGSAGLFALAHHIQSPSDLLSLELIPQLGGELSRARLWFAFGFRFLAGIAFGVLFWFRGFGIAAGSHILYDVIVSLLSGTAHAG